MRELGATTRELLILADWLKECGCEMVAMESTASYWKPLYKILESSDLNAMVVNARHMKAVPGQKIDVKNAEWIADHLQHGLLQPSYIPGRNQRELRELVRYRKSLVGERTREQIIDDLNGVMSSPPASDDEGTSWSPVHMQP